MNPKWTWQDWALAICGTLAAVGIASGVWSALSGRPIQWLSVVPAIVITASCIGQLVERNLMGATWEGRERSRIATRTAVFLPWAVFCLVIGLKVFHDRHPWQGLVILPGFGIYGAGVAAQVTKLGRLRTSKNG